MKKNILKKSLIGGLTLTSAIILNIEASEALSISVPSNYGSKIVVTGKADDGFTVMKYKFIEGASAQGNYYKGRELYREVYSPEDSNMVGGFIWYSIVPQGDVTDLSKTDLGAMYENTQTTVGTGGKHLVSGAGKNLKYGASDPWTGRYQGDNTGTKTILYGNYKGKKYEYRFTGYNTFGSAIGNPYFPADNQKNTAVSSKEEAGEYWSTKNWLQESWELPKSIKLFGVADTLNDYATKVQWIEKYFFKDYPAFRTVGDAYYWANRLRPLTNPETELGEWVGFHNDDGVTWYTQFITTPPAQNNLRLVGFAVRDENGKVVAQQYRNGTYNTNTKLYTETFSKYVNKGQTYTVTVTVKNMPEKVQDIDNKRIYIEEGHFADSQIGNVGNKYNEIDANSPHEKSLKTGEIATFKYDVTIPDGETPKKYFDFEAQIPGWFYDKGYNMITADDDAKLQFEIAPENLSVKFEGFHDFDRNLVDYVTTNDPMWVKYRVTKSTGTKPVNGADLKVMLTDEKSTTSNETYKFDGAYTKSGQPISDGILKNEGDYATFWASIIPTQPKLCTQGSIPAKWASAGVNNDSSDDVTQKYCLVNPDNIVVSNVVAKPETTYLANGQKQKSVVYTVKYNLTNYNYDKKDKDIPVVITVDGKKVYTETVPVQSLHTMQQSVVLPAVTVGEGEHVIQVEANPIPRKYTEIRTNSKGESIDPYSDNIGWDTVNVMPGLPDYCKVENTENTWNTRFTISYWQDYTGWSCNDWGCWPYTYRNWTYDYPVVGFYETHKIDHIYFKSKQTDNNWVDLKTGKIGEIKAGYGFEMKVVTSYETNTYNDTPKPYDYGSYGRLVSPQYSVVDSTSGLKITMPFTDDSGKPIAIAVDGKTTGQWYNNTTTYELDKRTVIKDEENKIYVNENTTDGDYSIRVETKGFYGSYDKPSTSKLLCDIEYVTIKVKGSYLDDVKTHIIQ